MKTTPTPEQQENRELLLAWLDAGAPEFKGPTDRIKGFFMRWYRTNEDGPNGCGTYCCMAGAMCALVESRPRYMDAGLLAADLLGIDTVQDWRSLFAPHSPALRTHNPAWAAAVLRHYFETGIVDWYRFEAVASRRILPV